jgi:hypothetical protein
MNNVEESTNEINDLMISRSTWSQRVIKINDQRDISARSIAITFVENQRIFVLEIFMLNKIKNDVEWKHFQLKFNERWLLNREMFNKRSQRFNELK